jgi:hypothetical protein
VVGVGTFREEEEPFPSVGSTDVGSSKTCPFRIEPERGQVPENSSEVPSSLTASHAADVLTHDPSGSSLANSLPDGGPSFPFVSGALPLPGVGVRLARPSSADEIDPSELSVVHGEGVTESGNSRPVSGELFVAPGIPLDLSDALPSEGFEGEVESSHS